MRARVLTAVVLAASCIGSPAMADDVTGKQQLLCAIAEVNFCFPGDPCDHGPPWVWNVPDFIEIDLAAKEIRTTKASGQNRTTAIRHVAREDGDLVVGGMEGGRAFTFSVTESTGEATMTVAAYGKGGVAFGSCTPMGPDR